MCQKSSRLLSGITFILFPGMTSRRHGREGPFMDMEEMEHFQIIHYHLNLAYYLLFSLTIRYLKKEIPIPSKLWWCPLNIIEGHGRDNIQSSCWPWLVWGWLGMIVIAVHSWVAPTAPWSGATTPCKAKPQLMWQYRGVLPLYWRQVQCQHWVQCQGPNPGLKEWSLLTNMSPKQETRPYM